jgi:hypothetical protein
MMKVKPICYVLLGIIIFAVIFLFTSLSYVPIKVKLLPSLASGLVLVLSVVLLGLELSAAHRNKTKADGEYTDEDGEAISPLPGNLISFAWLVGLVIGIYLIGFLISIPIWIIAYLKVRGKGWLMSLALATGTTAIIYILFIVLLQADLYEGIVFKILDL